jgi:hypothetical protein
MFMFMLYVTIVVTNFIIHLHVCVQTIPLLIIKPSGSLKAKHNELICCTNVRLYTRRIKKIARYMNLSRFKVQNLKVKSEN